MFQKVVTGQYWLVAWTEKLEEFIEHRKILLAIE